MKTIKIPYLLWFKLIYGMRVRSKGIKESGAFILSRPNSNIGCEIAFYDDFDSNVADSGIIQFKGAVKFYEYLSDSKYEVLADIHCHPGNDTRQSESDRTHPMIRIKGHTAIIAPNYCKSVFLTPKDCSIYEYLGEFKWSKCSQKKCPISLKLI